MKPKVKSQLLDKKGLKDTIQRVVDDITATDISNMVIIGMQTRGVPIAERIAERPQGFTLFSFLEQQATIAKVKENVKYMEPSEEESEGILRTSVVEMKLVEISLVQLVDFLNLVESSVNVVSVGRIAIQENSQTDGFLDVVMQIQTFTEKG
jgi:pyrimidine operon attenuation protein/uracil phosphoribosyltransferase